MIIDAILGLILSIPAQLLNSISTVPDLIIPQGTFDWFYNIFNTLTFVFPVWSVLPIIVISIGLKVFQCGYEFILKVKKFFWGN